MTDRDAPRPGPVSRPAPDPSALPRLSLKRLLLIGGIVLLAAGTGGSLLCPFRIGWQRAAEVIAIEDHMASLSHEKDDLRQDLRYRQTSGGKALGASEEFELAQPGGRVVQLVPTAPEKQASPRPTLSDRAAALRKRAGLAFYVRWRIFARYLLDRRLPPPKTA